MVSIILPAYNEEKAIGLVIDEIMSVMTRDRYDFEIIVVDDASTDHTANLVERKDVRLIRHGVNKGVGAARKTGILNSSGEIIVMLDADGTYPAKSIPEMLRYIPEYDQVVGSRRDKQGGLIILRQPIKWIIFKLASFLVKQKIPDLNSGLRIFKKNILLEYLYLIPDGFSCVTTMTLVFLYNGHTIKYLPIEYRKRIGKSKFNLFRDTLFILSTIIRMWLKFGKVKDI